MAKELSIADVIEETTVDGPGFRTVVYAAGCPHACKGCHNPHTWDIASGRKVPVEDLADKLTEDPFSDVTFSGGDPLMQVEGFTELAKIVKARSSKNIWCYTGYLFEEVVNDEKLSMILPYIDVMVDGPFVEELKSKEFWFRGSGNQRLIDVKASLAASAVVLWEEKKGI